MAIDWKLYERDVNRWYLDEGKTANEVIRLLLENYNLIVTSVFWPTHHKTGLNLTSP